MQSLDVQNSGLPDLQFVLLVTALCTSDLPTLNVPPRVRQTIFDRCWVLVNDTPPPVNRTERVLDLRQGTDTTLEALVVTIQNLLAEAGIGTITWDHPPSDPSLPSSPQARPLIERLDQLYPRDDNQANPENGVS